MMLKKLPNNNQNNGIRKPFTNYNNYTFKENEVFVDKPVYLGFDVIELSKLLVFEKYYDKFQPFF